MAVVFQALGGGASATTASLTLAWPVHEIGDLGLLFVTSSAGGTTETLSTANGFQLVTTQSTGTGTAGTKLSVYWCRATSTNMTSPIVAAGTDFKYGYIQTFRGVKRSGSPIHVFAGDVKAAASTAITFPAVTTTVNDALIVLAAAKDTDSTAAFVTSYANTNLTSMAKRRDSGSTSGLGGGIATIDGYLPVAGNTGITTGVVSSSINAMITLALVPELLPTVALNTANAATTAFLEFTGTDGNGDALTYEIQIDTVNTFDSQ